MKIISVSNPIYAKADNSAIDCDVVFDDENSYKYTAVPNDSEEYGVDLWNNLNSGKYGAIFSFPGLSNQQIINLLVSSATSALIESGITVDRITEAVSLGLTTWTAPDVISWMNYRRDLRAIISTRSGTLPIKPAYPQGT